MTKGINGPLMKLLAARAGHKDTAAVDMFRYGADATGLMTYTGLPCTKEYAKASLKAEKLNEEKLVRNSKTIKAMQKVEEEQEKLIEEIRADASLGRMSMPRELSMQDMESFLLTRRFGINQGLRSDGTVKIRSIDDMTASGVNDCCEVVQDLRCDSIDRLVDMTKIIRKTYKGELEIWKADINAAYRRIPAKKKDRKFLSVAFRTDNGNKTIKQ